MRSVLRFMGLDPCGRFSAELGSVVARAGRPRQTRRLRDLAEMPPLTSDPGGRFVALLSALIIEHVQFLSSGGICATGTEEG
jgi:hypothetical protein